MLERHRIEPMLGHDRMRSACRTMHIELFLEHAIDQRVDGKWRALRSANSLTVIKIEAPPTSNKGFKSTAAHLERLVRVAVE
jgi:hypothetical protein